MSLKVGKYEFRGKTVTYDDGTVIDLGKIEPLFIGILKVGDRWAASIITSNSLKKMKEGITENLESIGFLVDESVDAVIIQNYLTMVLLDGKESADAENAGDTNK